MLNYLCIEIIKHVIHYCACPLPLLLFFSKTAGDDTRSFTNMWWPYTVAIWDSVTKSQLRQKGFIPHVWETTSILLTINKSYAHVAISVTSNTPVSYGLKDVCLFLEYYVHRLYYGGYRNLTCPALSKCVTFTLSPPLIGRKLDLYSSNFKVKSIFYTPRSKIKKTGSDGTRTHDIWIRKTTR